MRDVTVHDGFVPAGAPEGTSGTSAVPVSAGTRWPEAYEAATAADLYVQGGGCTSVGASGGFILGSGLGSYSKRFGTGSGGVLEFEIITADGEIRVVNQHQAPDLFWAQPAILVGLDTGKVEGFDVEGKRRATFDADDAVHALHWIESEGAWLVGSDDQHVYRLDTDLQPIWQHAPPLIVGAPDPQLRGAISRGGGW